MHKVSVCEEEKEDEFAERRGDGRTGHREVNVCSWRIRHRGNVVFLPHYAWLSLDEQSHMTVIYRNNDNNSQVPISNFTRLFELRQPTVAK